MDHLVCSVTRRARAVLLCGLREEVVLYVYSVAYLDSGHGAAGVLR